MHEPFGSNFHTISDSDGNDYVLEHLDTIEEDGTFYLAFLPADMNENDRDYGLIILKTVEENGEEVLATVDDENKLNDLFERFTERLSDEDND